MNFREMYDVEGIFFGFLESRNFQVFYFKLFKLFVFEVGINLFIKYMVFRNLFITFVLHF